MKRFILSLPIFVTLWLQVFSVQGINSAGQEDVVPHSQDTAQHHKKPFNASDFIFDHIGDAHEWHIATVGKAHISIPLPIILYSRTRNQIYCFWSSKFHHGHEPYKGFQLMLEGEKKGKIVELDAEGNVLDKLPLDFSIKKNVAAIFFSIILMCFIFISVAKRYQANPTSAPRGLQNVVELIIIFIRDDVAIPSIGDKKYFHFMPFLLTIFFFIWINNMLGLIPIFPAGANITGNIAVTMALALFSFFIININGNKQYWKHIINAPGVPMFLKIPIPIMPFVEIMGVIIKPFVLMVRLFANILAGHIVAMVLFALIFIFAGINVYFGYAISVVSLLLAIFMTLLELLVAFIQAYVFTILTAIFIGMSTAEHH